MKYLDLFLYPLFWPIVCLSCVGMIPLSLPGLWNISRADSAEASSTLLFQTFLADFGLCFSREL